MVFLGWGGVDGQIRLHYLVGDGVFFWLNSWFKNVIFVLCFNKNWRQHRISSLVRCQLNTWICLVLTNTIDSNSPVLWLMAALLSLRQKVFSSPLLPEIHFSLRWHWFILALSFQSLCFIIKLWYICSASRADECRVRWLASCCTYPAMLLFSQIQAEFMNRLVY